MVGRIYGQLRNKREQLWLDLPTDNMTLELGRPA
jgi:hypothetical protein